MEGGFPTLSAVEVHQAKESFIAAICDDAEEALNFLLGHVVGEMVGGHKIRVFC
jgi:hypothetical protein